jgi:hypothetical protein
VTLPPVIAGLDPAIHPTSENVLRRRWTRGSSPRVTLRRKKRVARMSEATSGFCPPLVATLRRRHDVTSLGVPDTSHTRRAFGRDLPDLASLIRAT